MAKGSFISLKHAGRKTLGAAAQTYFPSSRLFDNAQVACNG